MKTRSTKSIGALHPVLFFTGVYFVALVFSIFICSTIFYSCNTGGGIALTNKHKQQKPVQQEQTTALSNALASK